jgi:hypothetical protein
MNFFSFYDKLFSTFLYIILALSFGRYFFGQWADSNWLARKFSYKSLIWIAIFLRILYAALKTAGQYCTWLNDNGIARFLLPPHQPINYFILYSFRHFWINALLSVALSLIFYFFLKLLKNYRTGLFERGDENLGLLACSLAGWPLVIIFIPLAFVVAIISAIFRKIAFKETLTSIGIIFLVAAAVVMIFGNVLSEIFNLEVLRI